MQEISLLEMLKSGVHFGHQKKRWHPKMKQFIFTIRSGIHIIDLEKTAAKLEEAGQIVMRVAAQGGRILFVATKRQAQTIVKQAAQDTNMPFVTERWIGGTLTNFDNISKLSKRLKDLREKTEKGELDKYTKRERLQFSEEIEYLEKLVGGIQNMSSVPQLMFIVDTKKEKTAMREAKKKNIPIIAIVDTNNNPDLVDCPIPANDDATKSIKYIVEYLLQAIEAGQKQQKEAKEPAGEPEKPKGQENN